LYFDLLAQLFPLRSGVLETQSALHGSSESELDKQFANRRKAEFSL
jgi:hypothetical protein